MTYRLMPRRATSPETWNSFCTCAREPVKALLEKETMKVARELRVTMVHFRSVTSWAAGPGRWAPPSRP